MSDLWGEVTGNGGKVVLEHIGTRWLNIKKQQWYVTVHQLLVHVIRNFVEFPNFVRKLP